MRTLDSFMKFYNFNAKPSTPFLRSYKTLFSIKGPSPILHYSFGAFGHIPLSPHLNVYLFRFCLFVGRKDVGIVFLRKRKCNGRPKKTQSWTTCAYFLYFLYYHIITYIHYILFLATRSIASPRVKLNFYPSV